MELEKYRDIDEEKLLRELTPEELDQLDLELQDMDPEVRPPTGLAGEGGDAAACGELLTSRLRSLTPIPTPPLTLAFPGPLWCSHDGHETQTSGGGGECSSVQWLEQGAGFYSQLWY